MEDLYTEIPADLRQQLQQAARADDEPATQSEPDATDDENPEVAATEPETDAAAEDGAATAQSSRKTRTRGAGKRGLAKTSSALFGLRLCLPVMAAESFFAGGVADLILPWCPLDSSSSSLFRLPSF